MSRVTEAHIKEQISSAYAKAIAAQAGVIFREYSSIDYGFDGKFSEVFYDEENKRYSESGFGIDVQIKATTNITSENGKLIYDLEVKNYRDLIKTNVGTPRILIVYSMPEDKKEWVTVTTEQTILKKCAWWCSLKGKPKTNNKETIRVEIPDNQLLTPSELLRLIEKVKVGASL